MRGCSLPCMASLTVPPQQISGTMAYIAAEKVALRKGSHLRKVTASFQDSTVSHELQGPLVPAGIGCSILRVLSLYQPSVKPQQPEKMSRTNEEESPGVLHNGWEPLGRPGGGNAKSVVGLHLGEMSATTRWYSHPHSPLVFSERLIQICRDAVG